MNIKKTAKALAIAALVGASSHVFADSNTPWWRFDFDTANTGTSIASLTNEFGWAMAAEEDKSDIASDGIDGNFLNLDTQGNNLTFTPGETVTYNGVLIDADVYLVGADSAPNLDQEGEIQTAVYLRNDADVASGEVTNRVLCAYVGVSGDDDQGWIELKGFDFNELARELESDSFWVHLRIEIDYSNEEQNVLRFFVDQNAMFVTEAGDVEKYDFDLAYSNHFSTRRRISEVSFRGTGGIDNFVGATYYNVAAQSVVDAIAYVNSVLDESGFNDPSVPEDVENGKEISGWAFIRSIDGDEVPTENYLISVKVFTNDTDSVYREYAFTYDDNNNPVDYNNAFTPLTDKFTFLLPTPSDATVTNVIVVAYYGTPTIDPGPGDDDPVEGVDNPEIKATDGSNPIYFDPVSGDFVVTIKGSKSKFWYIAKTATDLTAGFETDFSAPDSYSQGTGTDEEAGPDLELKVPTTGKDTLFIRVYVQKDEPVE